MQKCIYIYFPNTLQSIFRSLVCYVDQYRIWYVTCLLLLFFATPASAQQYCSISSVASGSSTCIGGYILCPAGSPCSVTCPNYQACYQAIIDASQATSLTLICSAQESCSTSTITCPSNGGTCNVTASGYNAIYHAVYNASSSYASTLRCTSSSACQSSTLLCSTVQGQCNVFAGASNGALSMNISSLGASSLSVQCSGNGACQNIIITCPSSQTNYGYCSILCSGSGSCYGSTITRHIHICV